MGNWTVVDDALDDAVEGRGSLKPQGLMDDLAKSGVKYNPDDVVMVTKTPDGRLMWLEKGKTGVNGSGLEHIIEGHAIDFANKNVAVNDISSLLKSTLQNTPISTGTSAAGPFADYIINGDIFRVAYGTNGYIVSFYPISQ